MIEPDDPRESIGWPSWMPAYLGPLVLLAVLFAAVSVALQLAAIDYALRKVGIEAKYLLGLLRTINRATIAPVQVPDRPAAVARACRDRRGRAQCLVCGRAWRPLW
jgi:hypothetical protein